MVMVNSARVRMFQVYAGMAAALRARISFAQATTSCIASG
jgi:hypothetical protein